MLCTSSGFSQASTVRTSFTSETQQCIQKNDADRGLGVAFHIAMSDHLDTRNGLSLTRRKISLVTSHDGSIKVVGSGKLAAESAGRNQGAKAEDQRTYNTNNLPCAVFCRIVLLYSKEGIGIADPVDDY